MTIVHAFSLIRSTCTFCNHTTCIVFCCNHVPRRWGGGYGRGGAPQQIGRPGGPQAPMISTAIALPLVTREFDTLKVLLDSDWYCIVKCGQALSNR